MPGGGVLDMRRIKQVPAAVHLSSAGGQADRGALHLPDPQWPHQVGHITCCSDCGGLQQIAPQQAVAPEVATALPCGPNRASTLPLRPSRLCRSMAGVNTNNVERLAEAIHKVTTA